MDRGRKLRKHIFRILEMAALNGLTHCSKSEGHIAVDDGCRLVKTRIFREIWEVEHGAERLETELVRLVARSGAMGGWSTHCCPGGACSRARLDGARQSSEGSHLLAIVLIDL